MNTKMAARKPWVEVEEPVESEWFDNELLAISCYMYRNNIDHIATRVVPNLQPCDYAMAEQIRHHFKNKTMLNVLQGKKLSNFRQDLATFLETDYTCQRPTGFLYPIKILGLVTKLPHFYEYDTKLCELFEGNYRKVTGAYTSKVYAYAPAYDKWTETVQFKTRIRVNTRKQKVYEYWFETSQKDFLVIPITVENPLEHVFHRLVETTTEFKLVGNFFMKCRDSLEYLTVGNWNMV